MHTAISLYNAISEVGDAIVDYVNSAGKQRYAVVTVDFTTPYVLDKVGKRINEQMVLPGELLLVYSWDADKLIRIAASGVKRITPLSKILANA